MSLDNFITEFGGWTEEYEFKFPDGTTEHLRYDPKEHVYYLVRGDELQPLNGVTQTVHIIDKSEALIPWACKMMAQKLLTTVPTMFGNDWHVVSAIPYSDFEKLVTEAKGAHKEKLEEAGAVGHAAHAWIEDYIKACIKDSIFAAYGSMPYPEEERAANCCKAALEWMDKHNVRWLETERKIFSREHNFAGTMDGLCLVDSCDNATCCPEKFTDRLTVADWKTSNYLYPEYLLQTAAYLKAFREETGKDVTDRWVIRLGKEDGEFDPWHAGTETFEEDWAAFHQALLLTRSMKSIKERVKVKERYVREIRRAEAKAAKEAALKIKCSYASKYKGVRAPNCNKGNPCEACLAKYAEVQKEKSEQSDK